MPRQNSGRRLFCQTTWLHTYAIILTVYHEAGSVKADISINLRQLNFIKKSLPRWRQVSRCIVNFCHDSWPTSECGFIVRAILVTGRINCCRWQCLYSVYTWECSIITISRSSSSPLKIEMAKNCAMRSVNSLIIDSCNCSSWPTNSFNSAVGCTIHLFAVKKTCESRSYIILVATTCRQVSVISNASWQQNDFSSFWHANGWQADGWLWAR